MKAIITPTYFFAFLSLFLLFSNSPHSMKQDRKTPEGNSKPSQSQTTFNHPMPWVHAGMCNNHKHQSQVYQFLDQVILTFQSKPKQASSQLAFYVEPNSIEQAKWNGAFIKLESSIEMD